MRKLFRQPLYLPAVAILALVLVFLSVLGVYSLRRLHSEQQEVARQLTRQGRSIIESIESSTRIGMMGMMWGPPEMQGLFEEIARQQDVEYLYLVEKETGKIRVASSADDRNATWDGDAAGWLDVPADSVISGAVVLRDGRRVFQVAKRFQPASGMRHTEMMRRWQDVCRMMSGTHQVNQYVLLLGLSLAPYQAARAEDLRRALGTGAVLLVLGAASLFFVAVIQKYYVTNQSLVETESYLQNLVESVGHGLISLDPDERVVTVNRRATEILQMSEGDLIGRPFRELTDRLQCGIDLTAAEFNEKKVRCRLRDGQTVPLSVTTSKIRSPDGEFLGTVLILRDLQEMEALQERVQRSERLASLGQMAAGIAHEVRNPLGAIKGLAQYFARKFEADPAERQYAEAIISETDRLNRVIQDLLDFARPHEPRLQPVQVADIIDHALRLVQTDLDARGIKVERSGPADLPELMADPDLLAQALLNLFLNAMDAMEDGGTLTVAADMDESAQRIRLEIRDTGHGIEPQHLPKIFDPFFTSKRGGTGLGLAIVHRIIENHRGSIDVESQPGEGTRFVIWLPRDHGA